MKTILLSGFILLMQASFSQEAVVKEEEKAQDLDVAVGIDKIERFDFDFSTKVQVGDPRVLSIQPVPQKRELIFKGIKKGTSSVIVRDTTGNIKSTFRVNVTTNGPSNTVAQLRELLEDVEGLEVGIKGGRVYVGGELVVPKDWGKVSIIMQSDDFKDVLSLVELSPQTQRVIARKMKDEFNRNGLRNVNVRVINGTFWLEGVVSSEGQKAQAEKIANLYLPSKLLSLASGADRRFAEPDRKSWVSIISINQARSTPPPVKLLKVSAQFVELSKDYSKIFGFKWAPFMNRNDSQINLRRAADGSVSSNSGDFFSATISNLFPKIQSLKSAGYARILQSGMVVTRDGQRASIAKTAATPFSVGSGEFLKAATRNVGFNMNVTPRILNDENVEMALNISVSIPGTPTADGNPTSTSNSIGTNVIVKSKESAVIGGVVQSTSLTAYDKNDPDPATQSAQDGQGSPLFVFLRSKSHNISKNQYVVFVTPEIIDSATQGTDDIRKKFRRSR